MATIDYSVKPNALHDREHVREDPTAWSLTSANGVIATAHYLASAAGAEMLAAGGNAVDAAVAASLALNVCEPAGSGLGGMAVMLIHLAEPGRTFVLEGPCRAPRTATPEAVAGGSRYRGHRAVAVPGHARVLEAAHGRYGRLERAEVIAPAIRLADEGHQLTPLQARLRSQYRSALRNGNAGGCFLDPAGEAPAAGTLFRQPALAATLLRLAEKGFGDFYTGDVGAALVRDMARHQGFIAREDLASVPLPAEMAPLRYDLEGACIHCPGPPAGGIALIEMLNLFAALNGNRSFDARDPDAYAQLAAIMRKARQDRIRFRLKTGAAEPGPAAELLTEEYARAAAADLQGGETSHLSVIDRWGNAVALTQSIERSFGAAVMSPELGFLYNGFLRAFKVENRRHPHYLLPGTPARSNAAPSIALRNGRPWAVLGSTGSERSTSAIFTILLRLLAGEDAFHAVAAPRLHCTPDGDVLLEAARFAAEVPTTLVQKGFRLDTLEPYSFKMGGVQLAMMTPDGGAIGVADPRRDGASCGVSD